MKTKLIKEIKKTMGNALLPTVLGLLGIGITFVLFRMKSVEVDYRRAGLIQKIDDAKNENRDLRARKAGILSPENLLKVASKHKFFEPKSSQIIVVP